TPVTLVVLWAGLTPPPPEPTAQFTTTPGTGQLLASRAVTLKGVGSGLSRYHAAGSPFVFTSCVAGPGVQGPVPPPPSPPPPSASTPNANVNRGSQRASLIGCLPFWCKQCADCAYNTGRGVQFLSEGPDGSTRTVEATLHAPPRHVHGYWNRKSCPRISPPAFTLVCTLSYVVSARICERMADVMVTVLSIRSPLKARPGER